MSREVQLAEQILDLVGDRAEAKVLASTGNLALTRFANSFIHQNVAEEGEAVSLRVAVGGRVASSKTTASPVVQAEAAGAMSRANTGTAKGASMGQA